MDHKQESEAHVESGGDKGSSIAAEHALSAEHAEYLLQRHGTLDLKPIPSAHHDDPYNWPAWKVRTNAGIRDLHNS